MIKKTNKQIFKRTKKLRKIKKIKRLKKTKTINKRTKKNFIKNKSNKKIINNKVYNNYLKKNILNTNIKYGGTGNIDEDTIKQIIKKSFKQEEFFKSANSEIKQLIEQKKKTTKDKWLKCQGECFKQLQELINIEISSTAYMLRILTESLVVVENTDYYYEINFILLSNISDLTGKWENDYEYFKLIIKKRNKTTKEEEEEEEDINPRLIIVVGPDGSGKSNFHNVIINTIKLTEYDEKYPECFLTINDDIYSKSSVICERILKYLHINELGFYNLFPSIFSSVLFSTSYVKDNIIRFLKTKNNKNRMSLYVCDSLLTCINCNIHSIYRDITDDKNWICVFIYQHFNKNKCGFTKKFEVNGNKVSVSCHGIFTNPNKVNEELQNGKKYQYSSWKKSFNSSYYLSMKPLNRSFTIHNPTNNSPIILPQNIPVKTTSDDSTTTKSSTSQILPITTKTESDDSTSVDVSTPVDTSLSTGGNPFIPCCIMVNNSIDKYNTDVINKKIRDYIIQNNYNILYFNPQEAKNTFRDNKKLFQ